MTDYMNEAFETWFKHQIWGNEDFKTCLSEAWQAALLAHIQRGAVPEGWRIRRDRGAIVVDHPKIGGYAATADSESIAATILYEFASAILAAAPAPDQFRDAEEKVADPAEVPMPEPVAYGIGNTAITGHTDRLMMVRIVVPLNDQYAETCWHPLVLADEARTYGDAREAAGYARGRKEAGRDAERLDLLDRNLRMRMGWHVGIAQAGNVSVSSVIQPSVPTTSIRDAIDAALRGEVKL